MPMIHRRRFAQLLAATSALFVAAPAAALAQQSYNLFDDIPIEDKVMGDVNAPVTLVEYASMTCPHCKTFHDSVLPELKQRYVETGKLKYILRPFPFDGDRRGEAAFMLAMCAPNDNYYPMIDALFSTQQVWGRGGNPVPELLRISKLSGMSEDDFKACLGNQELLTNMVKGRNKAVSDFGVRATPTVFVNGQKVEETSLDAVVAAIEGALS